MFQFLQSLDAVLSGRLLLLRGGGHQPVKMVAEHTTVDCHPKTMCRIRREENWWQNPDGLRKRRLRGLGARGIGRNPEENYGSWNNTVSGKGGSHCCLDPARGQREHVKYDTDWSLIDEIKLLLILGRGRRGKKSMCMEYWGQKTDCVRKTLVALAIQPESLKDWTWPV